MQTKTNSSKNLLCYSTQATLNTLYEVIGNNCDLLLEEAKRLNLTQIAPFEFIYFDCTNDMDKVFTLEIGLPVWESNLPSESKYAIKKSGDFKCFTHVYKGPLNDLFQIYEDLFSALQSQGLKATNQVREIYEVYKGMDSEENITEIQIGIV